MLIDHNKIQGSNSSCCMVHGWIKGAGMPVSRIWHSVEVDIDTLRVQ